MPDVHVHPRVAQVVPGGGTTGPWMALIHHSFINSYWELPNTITCEDRPPVVPPPPPSPWP
jgi:hypothetical protein